MTYYSASVRPVCTVTFENLVLEISFLVCGYVFGISRSNSFIKVIGSRSRSREHKGYTGTFVGGLHLIEWQCRYHANFGSRENEQLSSSV